MNPRSHAAIGTLRQSKVATEIEQISQVVGIAIHEKL